MMIFKLYPPRIISLHCTWSEYLIKFVARKIILIFKLYPPRIISLHCTRSEYLIKFVARKIMLTFSFDIKLAGDLNPPRISSLHTGSELIKL